MKLFWQPIFAAHTVILCPLSDFPCSRCTPAAGCGQPSDHDQGQSHVEVSSPSHAWCCLTRMRCKSQDSPSHAWCCLTRMRCKSQDLQSACHAKFSCWITQLRSNMVATGLSVSLWPCCLHGLDHLSCPQLPSIGGKKPCTIVQKSVQTTTVTMRLAMFHEARKTISMLRHK